MINTRGVFYVAKEGHGATGELKKLARLRPWPDGSGDRLVIRFWREASPDAARIMTPDWPGLHPYPRLDQPDKRPNR